MWIILIIIVVILLIVVEVYRESENSIWNLKSPFNQQWKEVLPSPVASAAVYVSHQFDPRESTENEKQLDLCLQRVIHSLWDIFQWASMPAAAPPVIPSNRQAPMVLTKPSP